MTQIIVGADPFPPYQYLDKSGNVHGTDYDRICQAFAYAGYKTIQVYLDDWSKVEAAVREKRIDAAFQVQKTPEREHLYFFSDLLRLAATEVISSYHLDDNLTWDAVKAQNLTIGVIENYAYGQLIDELPEIYKCEFNQQEALFTAIITGKVALGIMDSGVKTYLEDQTRLKVPYVIHSLTFQRPLHVIFHDSLLCQAFNKGLLKLHQPTIVK